MTGTEKGLQLLHGSTKEFMSRLFSAGPFTVLKIIAIPLPGHTVCLAALYKLKFPSKCTA